MKKIYWLFFCFWQMGLLAQDNCGIVPGFEYAVIGNSIQFMNTTQVTTPGVNINYYWWEFSDGGLIEGENPNYLFDGTCGLSVCLIIEADSLGLQETCYVDPL
jgi:hypothetical protein